MAQKKESLLNELIHQAGQHLTPRREQNKVRRKVLVRPYSRKRLMDLIWSWKKWWEGYELAAIPISFSASSFWPLTLVMLLCELCSQQHLGGLPSRWLYSLHQPTNPWGMFSFFIAFCEELCHQWILKHDLPGDQIKAVCLKLCQVFTNISCL